jgi:hypothetical protein
LCGHKNVGFKCFEQLKGVPGAIFLYESDLIFKPLNASDAVGFERVLKSKSGMNIQF